MPVADPATGEILFDEGHVLTGAECRELDAIGVAEVSVKLDSGDVIRVFTNRMCDMSRYVDFDPKECCGIKERVRFDVLQELLSQYSGEELMEQCRLHTDDLVPKHIIVDDILASINYMNCAGPRAGHQGRYRPSGQPPPALRGRAAAKPVPHRL